MTVVPSPTLTLYYTPAAFRLTATGQPDPTFGTGGLTTVATSGVVSVRVLADGRVVLAGQVVERPAIATFSADSDTHGLAMRLTPAGRLDTTYDTDRYSPRTAAHSPSPT